MNVRELSGTPPWDWPDEAGTVLLEALGDAGAPTEDRLLAADLAANLIGMDDDLARALVDVARAPEEPDELRATAAIALGPTLEALYMADKELDRDEPPVSGSVGRRIRTALRDLYMNPEAPKLVRRRALEASVRGYEEWHEGAIRAAYHDGDPEWRVTALFCMGFLLAFEPLIVKALESDDERVRFEALRAAGRTGVTRAWPHVQRILRSPTSERRWLLAAINASASVHPEEAPSALAPFLDSDDDEIMEAANDALHWAELLGAGEDVLEDEEPDDLPPHPFGNGDGGHSSGW